MWSQLGLKHPEEGDQLQPHAVLHLRQVFRTEAGDPILLGMYMHIAQQIFIETKTPTMDVAPWWADGWD